jgi:hypothetical protein
LEGQATDLGAEHMVVALGLRKLDILNPDPVADLLQDLQANVLRQKLRLKHYLS